MDSEGKNPYVEPEPEKKSEQSKTVGDAIRWYQKDGYLDRDLLKRPIATETEEERHCGGTLLKFWDSVAIDGMVDKICDLFSF